MKMHFLRLYRQISVIYNHLSRHALCALASTTGLLQSGILEFPPSKKIQFYISNKLFFLSFDQVKKICLQLNLP